MNVKTIYTEQNWCDIETIISEIVNIKIAFHENWLYLKHRVVVENDSL